MKEFRNENNLLLPVELSSDDENESHFTDANSHVMQSKSPEKISSKDQCLTKGAKNKGLKKEYEKVLKSIATTVTMNFLLLLHRRMFLKVLTNLCFRHQTHLHLSLI